MSLVLKALILSTTLFFATASFAKTLEIEVQFKLNGDYVEIDSQAQATEGWIEGKDTWGDTVYTFKTRIDQAELPFVKAFGDSSFSISKEGLIETGVSVGDSDSSADGSMTWPLDSQGNWISIASPLKLQVSGGDHASGSWSFSGLVSVKLID